MDGYTYEPSPYGAMINRALETHTNLGYTFSIVEMIVSPTRTEGYQQQVIRSFTSNVKVDDAGKIVDDMLLNNGGLTNNSQSTSNIMRVSSAPISNADIQSGWSSQRYMFKLKVKCTPSAVNSYGGNTGVYDIILSGYSDGSGDFLIPTTGGGFIADENLTFHINSLQRVNINTNTNSIVGIENIGVTTPESFMQNNSKMSVRPQDITSGISSKSYGNSIGGITYSIGTSTENTPLAFDRVHNVGKQYLNNILNAVIGGTADAVGTRSAFNNDFGSPREQSFLEATSRLRNDTLRNDIFIQALQQVNFNAIGYSFTINQLKRIDPTFTTDRLIYGNIIEGDRFGTDSILNSVYTHDMIGANKLTAVVSEVHNIITSLLTNNFLSSIRILIKNVYKPLENGFGMALQPEWHVANNDVKWSYAPAANNQNAGMLLQRSIDGCVKLLIDPLVSENGNLEYELLIAADTALDTSISISLAGMEPVLFRFPTFGDMCFTPMVGNLEVKESLITNIGVLANEIVDRVTSNDSEYNFGNGPMYI